jgi:fibrillarin-like rRNA methylase
MLCSLCSAVFVRLTATCLLADHVRSYAAQGSAGVSCSHACDVVHQVGRHVAASLAGTTVTRLQALIHELTMLIPVLTVLGLGDDAEHVVEQVAHLLVTMCHGTFAPAVPLGPLHQGHTERVFASAEI